MKTIITKILNPKLIIVFFIIFTFSMISIYISFDYTYKKMKALITIFYFLPGLLFFSATSVYNFLRYQQKNLILKFIILTPLIVIIIYILYALIQLIII